MKRIVSISLGSSKRDYEFTTTLLGQEINVKRLGTDGNVQQLEALLREYDGQVDAIGLGGVTPVFRVGNAVYQHQQAQRIAAIPRKTPVADGHLLKGTLERWAVKRAIDRDRSRFNYRRVFIFSGIERYPLANALSTYEVELRFGDPKIQLGLPFTLKSLEQLERYASMAMPILSLRPYSAIHPIALSTYERDSKLAAECKWADVLAGDSAFLRRYAPRDLRGKTVFTDDATNEEIADLKERGVHTLITMTPPLSEARPFVATDVLEAMALAVTGRKALDEASALEVIADAKWDPTVQRLSEESEPVRFAFVIHPLTQRHIYNHPKFKVLKYLPQKWVERGAAHIPPIYISKMRGIRSESTGQEIEGILFSLGATPRELMRRPESFTYRRLIRAARMAERMGAKLMGLGAFTSVVGDAGITVAQKADIGITSGNSLTVAATLEAAKHAVLLMGGRIDQGKAVVIGATGSIGAVCARLLAQASGNVVCIAPRPERLLALKQQIERETPGAKVTIATNPDQYVGDADLIVTTTSALTGKVINVDTLKPGAVVCDVARPPDVKEEDAARRPDVLVIESGEILLPGAPDFGFNIGLPKGTAYACLSEAALLAMEGIYDDYTLGRNLEMDRVKEMYRLARKHGLRLSGLRSFGKFLTEEDIRAKRELADELRRRRGFPVTPEDERAPIVLSDGVPFGATFKPGQKAAELPESQPEIEEVS